MNKLALHLSSWDDRDDAWKRQRGVWGVTKWEPTATVLGYPAYDHDKEGMAANGHPSLDEALEHMRTKATTAEEGYWDHAQMKIQMDTIMYMLDNRYYQDKPDEKLKPYAAKQYSIGWQVGDRVGVHLVADIVFASMSL